MQYTFFELADANNFLIWEDLYNIIMSKINYSSCSTKYNVEPNLFGCIQLVSKGRYC